MKNFRWKGNTKVSSYYTLQMKTETTLIEQSPVGGVTIIDLFDLYYFIYSDTSRVSLPFGSLQSGCTLD